MKMDHTWLGKLMLKEMLLSWGQMGEIQRPIPVV